MNLKPLLLMLGLACIPATLAAQKTYSLSSPDGNLRTTVTVGDEIRLRLDGSRSRPTAKRCSPRRPSP